MERGQTQPQGPLIRQRNPQIPGWAHYDRTGVSPAVNDRLAPLTWVKLRSRARGRHPRQPTVGAITRDWQRWGTRLTLATSAPDPDAGHLLAHREVFMTRPVQVQGHRRPYEGDWGYWSTRQGRHPSVSARVAKWLKAPRGPCRYGGLFFPRDDRLEVDHRHGNHHDSREAHWQALQGHGHEAKTREPGDSRPPGLRDTHQDTEERREANVPCAVLEQWSAEGSAYRL